MRHRWERTGLRARGRRDRILWVSLACVVTLGLVQTGATPGEASAAGFVEIETLSNRADLISNGDALVEIRLPGGRTEFVATLGDDDVTSVFAPDGAGRLIGRVVGLEEGPNELRVTLPDGSGAQLTIVNHDRGGPVISGEQVQPWRCETVENGLGPALDDKCNALPVQQLLLLDNGLRVRLERGTMNRGVYDILMPENWNGKVLYVFGAGTGQHYRQGTPATLFIAGPVPVGTVLNANGDAVQQGFAVVSNSMTENSQHSNDVTSAETVMMMKEYIIDTYGEIRYMIGSGESGGALQQYLVADAYPGLLDGLLPRQDWQDQIVGAYREFADCAALVTFMDSSPLWADDAHRTAVFGHGGTGVCSTSVGRAPDYMAADDGTACAGVDSYNAETNPDGVRCTLQDFMTPVYGLRPEGCDGQGAPCGRRPWDNVGVQYGLVPLLDGRISVEQFVDLNAGIGGYDINMVKTEQRTEADIEAVEIAHRTGRVTFGRGLAQVPILVERGTNNNDYHYPWRSYVNRNRLDRANGHHENHVLWTAGTDGPALNTMDQWLAAIESDLSSDSLASKVIRHRPVQAVDACWISGEKVTDQATCDETYPYMADTRVAAGEVGTSDLLKCQLKSLDRDDYGSIEFTDEQWQALEAAFPSGICDYSVPGVGQVDPATGILRPPLPWVSFADGPGGEPLAAVPDSVPFGPDGVAVDQGVDDAAPPEGSAKVEPEPGEPAPSSPLPVTGGGMAGIAALLTLAGMLSLLHSRRHRWRESR